MENKRVDGVEFKPKVFERVAQCARDEGITPARWLEKVGADVSRRIFRMTEWEERSKNKTRP